MISDGVRSFTYDALNRLTGVTGGSAPVTLAYDPFGRLGSYTASGATTSFRYAGPNLSQEYNGTTLLRSYASGEGADQWMLWMEGPSGAGSLRWLHQDRQGSVIAVSDAAGVVTPYAYGPYGEPQNWAGSRLRYTGQMAIPEAQLYHYRARAYDPLKGRFLQTDLIGYGDGPNIYAYVHGDPVNGTDPSGLCGTDAGMGAGDPCTQGLSIGSFLRGFLGSSLVVDMATGVTTAATMTTTSVLETTLALSTIRSSIPSLRSRDKEAVAATFFASSSVTSKRSRTTRPYTIRRGSSSLVAPWLQRSRLSALRR